MIEENQACADAAEDLVDQGATLVVSNSYGHQTYMQQVAANYPDVTFISMTGDTAAGSGLKNFKNAFNQTYQSRYVSGVVGGMKLAELIENGEVSPEKTPDAYTADGDIKIGYVGAFPYAEVVSGFTAFYLGVKSIVPNVHMIVEYTSSWADQVAEGTTAEKLIADGCVIISQHADTTGAPAAIQADNEAGKPVYSIGYNVSMLEVAPKAALTSASNDWSVYYKLVFEKWLDGHLDQVPVDWSEGYETGAVNITALGDSCAAGTDAKVAEVEAAIKNGTLNVFDTTTFTVGGEAMTEETGCDLDFDGTADIFPVKDGVFYESDTKNGFRSAPYFSFIIDGIDSNSNN
jgi:basic membrane protein A